MRSKLRSLIQSFDAKPLQSLDPDLLTTELSEGQRLVRAGVGAVAKIKQRQESHLLTTTQRLEKIAAEKASRQQLFEEAKAKAILAIEQSTKPAELTDKLQETKAETEKLLLLVAQENIQDAERRQQLIAQQAEEIKSETEKHALALESLRKQVAIQFEQKKQELPAQIKQLEEKIALAAQRDEKEQQEALQLLEAKKSDLITGIKDCEEVIEAAKGQLSFLPADDPDYEGQLALLLADNTENIPVLLQQRKTELATVVSKLETAKTETANILANKKLERDTKLVAEKAQLLQRLGTFESELERQHEQAKLGLQQITLENEQKCEKARQELEAQLNQGPVKKRLAELAAENNRLLTSQKNPTAQALKDLIQQYEAREAEHTLVSSREINLLEEMRQRIAADLSRQKKNYQIFMLK